MTVERDLQPRLCCQKNDTFSLFSPPFSFTWIIHDFIWSSAFLTFLLTLSLQPFHLGMFILWSNIIDDFSCCSADRITPNTFCRLQMSTVQHKLFFMYVLKQMNPLTDNQGCFQLQCFNMQCVLPRVSSSSSSITKFVSQQTELHWTCLVSMFVGRWSSGCTDLRRSGVVRRSVMNGVCKTEQSGGTMHPFSEAGRSHRVSGICFVFLLEYYATNMLCSFIFLVLDSQKWGLGAFSMILYIICPFQAKYLQELSRYTNQT